jgi:IPT/TIG domain
MDRERDRLVGGREGLRAVIALVLSLSACLLMAGTARAETVTIGTPTADFGPTGSVESASGCNNCTQYQVSTPNPVVTETAPADGVITAWRVSGGGTLTLEVLRAGADGTLSNVGGGGAQTATSGTGVPSQPVHIPVLKGDSIGVHLSGTSPKVFNTSLAADGRIGQVSPDVPGTPTLLSGLLSLNADVALTPVVTSISVTSGSTGGGTVTTITGLYLDGSTSVRFGAVPASSFTIVSPDEIEASSPGQGAGPVDVTVTGPGGTSVTSAADQFTYVAPPAPPGGANAQSPAGQGAGAAGGGSSLVISPLSLSASYFLAAPSGASIAKKVATGTKLTYVLSAPATTSFVVQQVRSGRLLPANSKGVRTCAPTTKALETLPKCSRYVSLTPHLTHKGGAGPNVVHLSGRLNGHALAPGPYRLVATATSTATPTLVSAAVTHSFHILAPSKSSKTTAKPKAHAALPNNGSGASSAPA